MIRILTLLVVFAVSTSLLQAQNQKILRASVTAEEVDLSGITIQNLSKKTGAVTNSIGEFEILVSPGDSLRITSVQIQPKLLVIEPSLYASSYLRIPLDPFVNELEGVTLNPYGLSRLLSEDVTRIELNPEVNASVLGLPNADAPELTQSQRLLYEATSGGGLIPLNPLLNALTGRTKMLKNRIALEAKNAKIDQVIKRYEKPLFEGYLAIDSSEILRFLYYCEQDSLFTELVAMGDELKFLEFMKKKSSSFKETNP